MTKDGKLYNISRQNFNRNGDIKVVDGKKYFTYKGEIIPGSIKMGLGAELEID
jgi:hypothetical protein